MPERGRVFLRGITSEHYGLEELREQQHAAPRVRFAGTVTDDESVGHSAGSAQSDEWWMLGPGDDPFLTQTLQVHFEELLPGGSNAGHGHQNEACFYILEGKGYDVHDDERYEWEQDDFVIVNTDSVHRHFNRSQTERALALVVKAKTAWLYLGLIQQGKTKPFTLSGYGDREDWTGLFTPGATAKRKVVKSKDTRWETTRDGDVRVITSPRTTDIRTTSVDVYEQRIPPGGRSAMHWHMSDEVAYVIAGKGQSLHWDVEAEIAERYYARIAKEPSRWDFGAGDVLYVPQNTVHRHSNPSATLDLRLVVAHSRLFAHLGYDAVRYLEDASTPGPEAIGASVTRA